MEHAEPQQLQPPRLSRNYATPTWVLPLAMVALLVLAGPLLGLLVSIPWTRVPELVTTEEASTAFALSLVTAVGSTVICVLLGTPLSLWLQQLSLRSARGRGGWLGRGGVAAIRLLVYAPLVLSPVVSGLAMIFFWGRRGLVGSWLDAHGIALAYTTAGVMMVQVFVALPFFVATTTTALGASPVMRHLMSRNFSAPRSAPNPASVTT